MLDMRAVRVALEATNRLKILDLAGGGGAVSWRAALHGGPRMGLPCAGLVYDAMLPLRAVGARTGLQLSIPSQRSMSRAEGAESVLRLSDGGLQRLSAGLATAKPPRFRTCV